VQAQAHETDRQHDQDGLDQHGYELVDRVGHRPRLVLQLHHPDAGRQLVVDAPGHHLERLAQCNDVATLGHRHTQGDQLPALVAHHHLRWIDIGARHLGNVGQADQFSRAAPDRHVTQLLERRELAGDPHLHRVQRGLHHARALDRVLLVQLRQALVHVQSELGQAFLRDLDKHLLVLHTEQFNLVDVGNPQQLLAHIVRECLEFRVGKTIRLQRIDDAIHVTEIIVEKWTAHARRQAGGHVGDPLSNRVPGIRHIGRTGRVLELKHDQRLAGLGVAADLVCAGHLLQRALDLVGHLLGHLLRRGAGPEDPHDHGPKRKRRILVLAELEIRGKTEHQQHQHQIPSQGHMLQRPSGKIEAGLGVWLRHHGVTSTPKPPQWAQPIRRPARHRPRRSAVATGTR